jgi:serine protease Do
MALLAGLLGGILVWFALFHTSLGGRFISAPVYTEAGGGVRRVAARDDLISASRRNAIAEAASKAGPAIVSITVVKSRVIRQQPYFSPFGDDFFDQFWRNFFPPREYRQEIQSLGSGVIINADGYVLTNDHVVHGADRLVVTLPDGRQLEGKLLGFDVTTDLALVKITGKDLPFATLGNSDNLVIGEWAVAIGNPFAYLLEDTQPTVTAGVISAMRRSIKPERGQVQVYKDMIQTDAAINPGNSGGALVNADGEVIGINTFIFSSSGGSEGIGFAIPINTAKAVVKDLLQFGEVKRVHLGVQVQGITPLLAESLGLSNTEGVVISEVEVGGLADRKGIQPGDVVKSINGRKIKTVSDWNRAVTDIKEGARLDLTVERGGRQLSVKL